MSIYLHGVLGGSGSTMAELIVEPEKAWHEAEKYLPSGLLQKSVCCPLLCVTVYCVLICWFPCLFIMCTHSSVEEALRNCLLGQWQGSLCRQAFAVFLEAGGELRRFQDEKEGSNGLRKRRCSKIKRTRNKGLSKIFSNITECLAETSTQFPGILLPHRGFNTPKAFRRHLFCCC